MLPRSAAYLDFNAGAPLRPEVKEALRAFLDAEAPGNPSSIHSAGRKARSVLEGARERVAASLGDPDPENLVFTSGGTEANQLAILAARGRAPAGGRDAWILSPVEHDSVLQLKDAWLAAGGIAAELDVDGQGRLSLGARAAELLRAGRVSLVSVVWANNETGVLTDLAPIAAACRAGGARLHVDAIQAWGKIPVAPLREGIDYLTLSGHKIGALPGTGALWKRPGAPFAQALLPGKQEKGRRGGTENLLGIHSLGVAAGAVAPERFEAACRPLQATWEAALLARFPGARVHGSGAKRVSNTTGFFFPGYTGSSLAMALDLEGFCVSAGSACSSGALGASHVLQAMGIRAEEAAASVRVSFGPGTDPAVFEALLDALGRLGERARRLASRQLGARHAAADPVQSPSP